MKSVNDEIMLIQSSHINVHESKDLAPVQLLHHILLYGVQKLFSVNEFYSLK